MATLVHDNALFLEYHTLTTPFELLRRAFRAAQRQIERDFIALAQLSADIRVLEKGVDGEAEVRRKVEEGAERVRGLKRKLADLLPSPTRAPPLRARLDHLAHLSSFATTADPRFAGWAERRFWRVVVEHFAREGREGTARALARATGTEALVDIDLHVELRRIETSLAAGSADLALSFCGEHRGQLKKHADSLEFALRLQQFVELCRKREVDEALKHLKKYLAPAAAGEGERLGDVRRALGLLACGEKEAKAVPAYAAMYNPARWLALRARFRTTFHTLYALPKNAPLEVALAVGISAFKLPFCAPPPLPPPAKGQPEAVYGEDEEDSEDIEDPMADQVLSEEYTATAVAANTAASIDRAPPTLAPVVHLPSLLSPSPSPASPAPPPPPTSHSRSCPTCTPHLHALSRDLPASHHMTSVLRCRISGRVLDDSDEGRAMCFPNGFVYSYGALKDMADANDGVVTCPRSGFECALDELRRVYIS